MVSFSGYISSHNSWLWSSQNSQGLYEQLLHDNKIGVWVEINRSYIEGPIFFEEKINSDYYCSDILINFMGQLTEVEINYNWLQQVNAVHTANRSMTLLDYVFTEWIISRIWWFEQRKKFTYQKLIYCPFIIACETITIFVLKWHFHFYLNFTVWC